MQIFNFNGATVRTVTLAGGEPGFVGKDVAERLGYKDSTGRTLPCFNLPKRVTKAISESI